MGDEVSVQPVQPASVRVELTLAERDRYVRWWRESSGLTPAQLRAIATALFSDRILDEKPVRRTIRAA